MSRIWYCPNCGYEIESKGRCHRCRQKLVASPLPALEAGPDESEVGYRIEDWEDRARGRLIEALVAGSILHRFEDDELVVSSDDEGRVDELIVEVLPDAASDAGEDDADDHDEYDDYDEEVASSVESLYRAAQRLRVDPTDMEADGDVAEASAGVFMADEYETADVETWAAVGRVTRRLLAALGSDEALDEEIRRQAGVLATLLRPVVESDFDTDVDPAGASGSSGGSRSAGGRSGPAGGAPGSTGGLSGSAEGHPGSTGGLSGSAEGHPGSAGGDDGDPVGADDAAAAASAAAVLGIGLPGSSDVDGPAAGPPAADLGSVSADEGAAVAGADGAAPEAVEEAESGPESEVGTGDGDREDPGAGAPDGGRLLGGGPETSYEAPEWMPEQRALLTVLLEERSIAHAWAGTDLVVPSEDEASVEELFDQIGGVGEHEDDEARYRALEELFAAVNRLANDPGDETKGVDVVANSGAVEGPTPLGFDDGQWLALRRRVRTLADAVEHDAHTDVVASQAAALRDTLRQLV